MNVWTCVLVISPHSVRGRKTGEGDEGKKGKNRFKRRDEKVVLKAFVRKPMRMSKGTRKGPRVRALDGVRVRTGGFLVLNYEPSSWLARTRPSVHPLPRAVPIREGPLTINLASAVKLEALGTDPRMLIFLSPLGILKLHNV
jgi:hypothetical protein